MSAANGVRRVWIGQNGLLSTPAVSAVIREKLGADVSNVFYSLLLVYLYFSLLCLECVLFPQRWSMIFIVELHMVTFFSPELKQNSG